MKNYYSQNYYLQVQQYTKGRSIGQALPRAEINDKIAVLTPEDVEICAYHAMQSANAGLFCVGKYQISLYEYYSTEPIDQKEYILS